MATRPAPGKKNQPPVAPAAKVGVGGSSKPPTPQVKPPTTQVKPPTTQPTTKTGQSKGPQTGPGPKPAGNPGPGRVWKVVNGRWQAVRKEMGGAKPPAGKPVTTYQPDQQGGGQGQDGGGTTGETEETVDVPKTKEQIESEAKTQVGYSDPQFSGQFTNLMSELGFGFGKADGTGYAGFADVFGTPGSTADTSKFVLRDAMGRPISPESYGSILGSDVFSEEGAKNIAGTALGNMIVEARRSAASEAEGRSSAGVGGGSGVAAADTAARGRAGEMGFGNLLRQLQSGVSEIQSGRGQAYLDALKGIGKEPGSVVQTTPGASAPGGGASTAPKEEKPKTPKAPKKGEKRVSGTGKNKWNQVWNGKKWVSVSRVK